MEINFLNQTLLQQNALWTAVENPITDLDDQTMAALLGATKPDDYVVPAETEMPAAALPPALPPSVDWRNNNGNHVSSIKMQGGCGSCVGFSTAAVFESMLSVEHQTLVDLSPADDFFCSSHGASCGGWWPLPAFQANQARGFCQEVLFPYATAFPNGDIWSSPPSCIVSPQRPGNVFNYANINTFTSAATAKAYIANTGPLSAVFDVYEDFYSYSSGIYHYVTGGLVGSHCIAVIGYFDDPNGTSYWICKNSWDISWGMAGFFNIAYGECNIDTNEKVGVSGTTLAANIL